MFEKVLDFFLGVVMLLAFVALLASVAFGGENPLADYTIYGMGLCGLAAPTGQRFASPCLLLGKEGDEDANYFGILDEEGEVRLILRKERKPDGETTIIWRRPPQSPHPDEGKETTG